MIVCCSKFPTNHPLGCDVVGAHCEPFDGVNAGSCCGNGDDDDTDCVVNVADTPVESVGCDGGGDGGCDGSVGWDDVGVVVCGGGVD